MKTVIALALCLTLAAGFALAREVTVTPVEDAGVLFDLRSDDPDCTVGNEEARWGYQWTGGNPVADYALKINLMGHPAGCDCPASPPFPAGAWALRNIGWMLRFLADNPVELQVALHSGTASLPGAELYASPVYTIDVPEDGYYWFTLAFDGDEFCIADAPAQNYYLVFRMLTLGVDRWVVGELPPMAQNKNFVNFNDGEGWNDMYQWLGGADDVGDLTIYAEVDCCLGGVQTDESSLSEIKQLFR